MTVWSIRRHLDRIEKLLNLPTLNAFSKQPKLLLRVHDTIIWTKDTFLLSRVDAKVKSIDILRT
jgi:hypothetical protein